MPRPKSPCCKTSRFRALYVSDIAACEPIAGRSRSAGPAIHDARSKIPFAMEREARLRLLGGKQRRGRSVLRRGTPIERYKNMQPHSETNRPSTLQLASVKMAQGTNNSNYHSFVSLGTVPSGGIIVPQRVYQDRTPSHPNGVQIMFPGSLYLPHALEERYRNNSTYEARPETTAPDRARLTLRILWPGYPDWECNINVRERNTEAQPVPMWLLARRIAEEIQRFSQEVAPQPNNTHWSFSTIQFDRLILYQLRQVTRGSWQVVILYDAP